MIVSFTSVLMQHFSKKVIWSRDLNNEKGPPYRDLRKENSTGRGGRTDIYGTFLLPTCLRMPLGAILTGWLLPPWALHDLPSPLGSIRSGVSASNKLTLWILSPERGLGP